MRINLLTFFLLITIATSKLAQVVSFFRHGARYALNSLYDGNDTRYIWGELSSVGMKQHESLGSTLRKEYIDKLGFLSSSYDRHEIEVYSTAINRTVQSVTSQLYGLYPPGTGPRLTIVDKQYYIPPFSSNKSDDQEHNYAFPNAHQIIPIKFDQKVMMDDCLNQLKEQNKNIENQLSEYKEMNLTYWPFINRMATLFNISGNVTLATMSTLNSDLECDRYLNRPLPSDFTADDEKNLKHIDSWYKQFTFVKDLAKAVNRNRLLKIFSVFDSRIKNPDQSLKWTFLSGHDLDIVPIFNDLNLSSSQCIEELYRKGKTSALNCEQYPEFASSLIFELYVEGNTRSIKIRSNGKYMNLCGIDSQECKYDDWRKRVEGNLGSEDLAKSICGDKSKSFENEEEQEDKNGKEFSFTKAFSFVGKTLSSE